MDYLKYLGQLEAYFEKYTIEIILVMGLLILLSLIFNLANRISISKTRKMYKEISDLLNAPNSENMEETVLDYIKQVNLMKNSVYSLEMNHEKLCEKTKKSIQQVGFLRYNAFSDMGSDLSFSAALLDDDSNGIVITNIYAKDESNVYAKPITAGTSSYALSSEEKEVVEIAMNKARQVEEVKKAEAQ